MDVVVRLEDRSDDPTVLAHVDSLPVPSFGGETRHEVVTLYGSADAVVLARAIAAALIARETVVAPPATRGVVRHLALRVGDGARGELAWREPGRGGADAAPRVREALVPESALASRADAIAARCAPALRRISAGLATPDWPEGATRALRFALASGDAADDGLPPIAATPGADESERAAQWLDELRAGEAGTFAGALIGDEEY